jgi:hypothetical protein
MLQLIALITNRRRKHMKTRNFVRSLTVFSALAVMLLQPGRLQAHCDGMDGPVVKAARQALETGDVSLVLIWVQKQNQAEITKAFERTMAVRKLGPQSKELADRYFFETLVRVHRAGEGAPYTGLQPAGRDLGPVIPAADRAIEAGSAKRLLELLTQGVEHGVQERFQHVVAAKNFTKDDVAAGREFVQAYVEFVHYVERVHQATAGPAHGHFPEADAEAAPERQR